MSDLRITSSHRDLVTRLEPGRCRLPTSVRVHAQEPAGRVGHGVANVPVVNGTPGIPVLSLHDLGDLFVPFSMEQVYASRVAAAGQSHLLVQRAMRGVDYCDFTATGFVRGFTDLVR